MGGPGRVGGGRQSQVSNVRELYSEESYKSSAIHPQDRLPLGILIQRAPRARCIDWSSSTDHRDHQSPCQMRYPLIFPSDKPEHRTKEKGMTTDDIANTHPKNTIQRHSSGRREF